MIVDDVRTAADIEEPQTLLTWQDALSTDVGTVSRGGKRVQLTRLKKTWTLSVACPSAVTTYTDRGPIYSGISKRHRILGQTALQIKALASFKRPVDEHFRGNFSDIVAVVFIRLGPWRRRFSQRFRKSW